LLLADEGAGVCLLVDGATCPSSVLDINIEYQSQIASDNGPMSATAGLAHPAVEHNYEKHTMWTSMWQQKTTLR
jgi:hypothetical protein